MVTRKPLPENAAIDPASRAIIQSAHQQSDLENIWDPETHQQQANPDPTPGNAPAALTPGTAADSGYPAVEEENVWSEFGAANGEANRVPSVLRPGGSRVGGAEPEPGAADGKDALRVPTVLRPGQRSETNPFKRSISAGSGTPPVTSVPAVSFSQLSVNESSLNPWEPAIEENQQTSGPATLAPNAYLPPSVPEEYTGNGVWDSAKPSRQATPGLTSNSPALLSLPSDTGSAGWEDESRKNSASALALPTPAQVALQERIEDTGAWDDLGNVGKGKAPAKSVNAQNTGATSSGDDWNLIDVEVPPEPPKTQQSEWDKFIHGDAEVLRGTKSSAVEDPAGRPPELPPRKSQDAVLPPPPRPVDELETYQIKKINWVDANAAQNPRTSPILVQNANGPCPLVALVNALILTTPADKQNTALIGALRSREQVSLELLLNAVFDELTSGGRSREGVDLPDVTELYGFLKGLTTGMNVNPRFIPTPELVTAFKRTSLTHLHPTERCDHIPGTFEDTKEMTLYSTFGIPLIHGWIPSKEEAAYESFTRQAASYEDAQNLLFREEELEEKLSSPDHQGLTEEEQQIYQDVLTIKSFLNTSATQLTKWGLEVIRKSMMPGSVAILFRNDHFSTLYKQPQTQQLLALVTDAGYAGHAEVVWESLVDVNGERAEFFSGDFRLVGGAPNEQQHGRSGSFSDFNSASGGDGDGWTTVQGRRGAQSSQPGSSRLDEAPVSPGREQEDRDLALALQLQEEEDERHRTEQERRQRESMLSEQYIEQQGRTPATGAARGRGRGGVSPTTTARRGNHGRGASQTSLLSSTPSGPNRRVSGGINVPVTTTGTPTGVRTRASTQTVRSLIPPRAPATNRPADEGLDDAPPSYEQAAKQTPYVPPTGHPSHPLSAPSAENVSQPVAGTNTAVRPQVSSGSRPSPAPARYPGQGHGPGPGPGPSNQRLRPGVPPAQVTSGGKDRDCIVM